MSVERLLEMQPGNLIELGNSIEGGVSLVVNGRRVGRGELLQVGDHLGVRLLELI